MATTSLPLQREIFSQEMAKHGVEITAYKTAYNTGTMKPSIIAQRAARLMKRADILTRISELKEKTKEIAEKKFEITQEEVLKVLNIVMKTNITDFLEFKNVVTTRKTAAGKEVKTKRRILQLKDLSKLSEEQKMCIEGIRMTAHGPEIKLMGKYAAIEKINRILGFYKEDPTTKKKIFDSPDARIERYNELLEKARKLKE